MFRKTQERTDDVNQPLINLNKNVFNTKILGYKGILKAVEGSQSRMIDEKYS
jgi:hypothetical protein